MVLLQGISVNQPGAVISELNALEKTSELLVPEIPLSESPLSISIEPSYHVDISHEGSEALANERLEQYSERAQLDAIEGQQSALLQQSEFVLAAQKYSQLNTGTVPLERRVAIETYSAIQQKVIQSSSIASVKHGPVTEENLES